MSAYLVFIKEREHDAAAMAEYSVMSRPTLRGHPVKPLVVYGAIETLEGPEAQGAVILEFPDMDAARAWYNSDAYQEARKVRFSAADYRAVLVQGI